MQELQLIKAEKFGEVKADIYSNGEDMLMTTDQLCNCLEEKRSTFDSWISRNKYLKETEFSVSCKLQGTDGKYYSTRLFNEDGIYRRYRDFLSYCEYFYPEIYKSVKGYAK